MDNDVATLTLRALRRILRATDIGSRQLAATTGLTPSQLLVLQEIGGRDHATPSAVAQSLQFSQATITAIVDRLASAGFVTRERGDRDKRQFILRATATGLEALEHAPDLLQTQFKTQFLSLPSWEQAMILAGLEKLSIVLGAEDIDAAPLLDSGVIDRQATDTSGRA